MAFFFFLSCLYCAKEEHFSGGLYTSGHDAVLAGSAGSLA